MQKLPSGYEIRPLTKQYFEKAVYLVCDSFMNSGTEPLCVGAQHDFDEYYKYTLADFRHLGDFDGNYSTIITKGEDEVAAVLLCGPYKPGVVRKINVEIEKIVSNNPSFVQWFEIMDVVREKYEKLLGQRFKKQGKVLLPKTFMMKKGGVGKKHMGKRLFQILVDHTLNVVCKKGNYEMVFADCTNVFSTGVLVKNFGFNIATSVEYDEYVPSSGEKSVYLGVNDKIVEFLKSKGKFKEKLAKGFSSVDVVEKMLINKK